MIQLNTNRKTHVVVQKVLHDYEKMTFRSSRIVLDRRRTLSSAAATILHPRMLLSEPNRGTAMTTRSASTITIKPAQKINSSTSKPAAHEQPQSHKPSKWDNLLSEINDPDLDTPIKYLSIGSHVIVDPASPLLDTRRSFATATRKLFQERQSQIDPESLVVPRHPTLDRSSVKRKGNLQKVRNVLAVSSGKGGVGKSTVSVNLAASLSMLGARVGIFDADIHGPSLPTMLVRDDGGTWTVKRDNEKKTVSPVELHGMKCMSYGFVSPGTGGKGERAIGKVLQSTRGPQASIMRGPIASKTAEELLTQTEWGELDFLILDLPPGTGDLHLTMCQQLQVDAAVVVTTPQELSFVDVARGIDMLEALKIPVIAIVENMSWFVCDHGKVHYPFGTRGKANLERLKTAYGVAKTVSLPIVSDISHAGDEGIPFVLQEQAKTKSPSEPLATYLSLARDACNETLKLAEFGRSTRPQVVWDASNNMIVIRIFDGESARQFKIPPLEVRKRLNKVDEMMGLKNIPVDTVPKQISPKGNYAVSISWSDGHSMSIYPYDDLVQAAEEYAQSKIS